MVITKIWRIAHQAECTTITRIFILDVHMLINLMVGALSCTLLHLSTSMIISDIFLIEDRIGFDNRMDYWDNNLFETNG